MIAFKFPGKISHIQDTLQKIYHTYLRSHHFTLQHYFHVPMQSIFMCACAIFVRNSKTREFLGSRFIGYLKLFSVSTINSMCAVLCSVIVSELLKMRKSPAINYWQDTTSGLEVNSNVRNISKLRGILTSFVILYYFSF